MNQHYVLLNGHLHKQDEPIFSANNLLNGTGLNYEHLHSTENTIQFLKEHLKQIHFIAGYQNIALPKIFTSPQLLVQEIARLLNKNKFFLGASVKLYYKNDQWLACAEPLSSRYYELSGSGQIVDCYKAQKAIHPLSNFQCGSEIYWSMAKKFCSSHNIPNCILMNEEDKLCEAIGANIFLVHKDQLYTPPLNSGCYHDVIREKLLDIAKELNLSVQQTMLSTDHLFEADEIFIASAATGIEWVKGVHAKRYLNKVTRLLTEKLNESVF